MDSSGRSILNISAHMCAPLLLPLKVQGRTLCHDIVTTIMSVVSTSLLLPSVAHLQANAVP